MVPDSIALQILQPPVQHRIPDNNSQKTCTHRHPQFSPRKPPIIGPITGPNNGAEENATSANPRWRIGQISATTPPAFVKGEAPKVPAKNLMMSSPSMFGAAAHPALKAVRATNYLIQY